VFLVRNNVIVAQPIIRILLMVASVQGGNNARVTGVKETLFMTAGEHAEQNETIMWVPIKVGPVVAFPERSNVVCVQMAGISVRGKDVVKVLNVKVIIVAVADSCARFGIVEVGADKA